MDIRQLEYFVQIATLGGFNRASARLYIAQSALSRQIKLLEEELGVALFIRNKRGVEMTAAGQLLLERSTVLLHHFKQVRDEVIAQGGAPRGELLIGLPPSLQSVVAVPLLKAMSERYPLVFMKTWVATSAELKQMVLSGEVDFAVVASFQKEPSLQTELLFRDDMLLVGPVATMPKAASIGAADLAGYPLILSSAPQGLRGLVEDAAAHAGVALNVIMEVNYLPTLIDLAANGVAHTLLSSSAYGAADARVAAVRVEGLACDWVAAWRKDHPLSAAARAANEVLEQLLTREADAPRRAAAG